MSYADFIRQMVELNGRPSVYAPEVKRVGYDKHHIRPIWMYPGKRHNPEGNSESNLVWLTRNQHVRAHILLALETDAFNDWHSLAAIAGMYMVKPSVKAEAAAELRRRGFSILSGKIQPMNLELDLSPLASVR